MSEAYKRAGVDVEAGYQAVERMKKHIARTGRPEVMGALGGFGGMFDISGLPYKEPVLISGTDGVGTKLMLAFEMNKHDTIGQDVVAMCVNDIAVQGADPLYFLDYLALGKADPEKVEQIVKGVADGCVQAGCAVIGGETAEMPGMYSEEEYDLAGFAVGAAEKADIPAEPKAGPGDAIIGVASSGVHSNGFSLVRKVLFEDGLFTMNDTVPPFQRPLGEELLEPTKIYVNAAKAIKQLGTSRGMAHITGGGFFENVPRMLPDGCGAMFDVHSWQQPEIFPFIQNEGHLSPDDMFGTFNMGIGLMTVVPAAEKENVLQALKQAGEEAWAIGEVTDGGGVQVKGATC